MPSHDAAAHRARPPRRASTAAVRVAEPGASFWGTKLLTTAMGEATSDFAVHSINPVVAVLLGGLALVLALALQLQLGRYRPPVYWFAVTMVAVAGTMDADVVHIEFGVPYLASALLFALLLAGVFAYWRRSEGTLSVHEITTAAREGCYWAAVIATFALGTAAGDLSSITFHLGYQGSIFLYAGLICAPAFAWQRLGANPVICFWAAYVLTRPLGASIADWLGKPVSVGGVGVGAGVVALVSALVIVALVGRATVVDLRRRPLDLGAARRRATSPGRAKG